MLTRYLPWVPMRGVPMRCFCHVCLKGGGGGLPMCPSAYTLFPNVSSTNLHQPGVCLPTIFTHTPLGEGVLGVICIKYTQHPGILSLGAILLPLGWGRVYLLVCVPVCFPIGIFFLALWVCSSEWIGGREGASDLFLHPSSTISLSLLHFLPLKLPVSWLPFCFYTVFPYHGQ